MDKFASHDLSTNAFLGGRLQIAQPRHGYRAGVDPVLLGAATDASSGDMVLDLGCGAGVAGLCVAARVPDVALHGVEIQPAYSQLAQDNGRNNAIDLTLWQSDIRNLPRGLKELRFHHVIANPPYFREGQGTSPKDSGRATSLAEDVGMDDWVRTASKRLLPNGTATFIQRIDRMPELIAAFQAHLGSLQVLPIAPRSNRPANLFLVKGRKGGKAAFRLLPPLILHVGDKHEKDGDDYTSEVSAILREGEPINWPR